MNTIVNDKRHEYFNDLSEKLTSNDTLMMLLTGDYDHLGESTSELLDSFFNQEYDDYSRKDFIEDLHGIYARFQVYQQLKFDAIIMDWDREKGRLYIKGKNPHTKKFDDFLEFLKGGAFYSEGC